MQFLKNKSIHLINMDLVLIPPKEEHFQKLNFFVQMKNDRFHAFIITNQDTLLVGVTLWKNSMLLTIHGSQEGHWGLTPKDPK